MATSAFLKLTGQTQGAIKGSVTQKGHEGQIQVTSWTWAGERNSSFGSPSGPATASEFHITKKRDSATPLLLNAFANDEEFTFWRLELLDPSLQGGETLTSTIQLTQARLASFRNAGVDTGATTPPDHDELTFSFSEIEIIWTNGGITGTFEP